MKKPGRSMKLESMSILFFCIAIDVLHYLFQTASTRFIFVACVHCIMALPHTNTNTGYNDRQLCAIFQSTDANSGAKRCFLSLMTYKDTQGHKTQD
jgi:hypothetical protein